MLHCHNIVSLVSQHPGEEVVVYIPKQRVGLVKRGSYTTESLTLKNIVARQAISITVTENKQFVMVNIPANDVLRQQVIFCRTQMLIPSNNGLQKVDVNTNWMRVPPHI